MLLAHGTSAFVAKNASKKGLFPRSVTNRKTNWTDFPSNRNCIYLTSAYAFHYAKASAKKNNEAGIVEIDTTKLDPFLLCADEDALEQASRKEMTEHMPLLKDRTKWFRDRLKEYAASGMGAEWSLDVIGNCAYYGSIPAEAVSRAVVIKNWSNPYFTLAFDPVPGMMNYQLIGDRYREMQKLFLGRPFDMDVMMGGFYDERMRNSYENFVEFVDKNREIVYSE